MRELLVLSQLALSMIQTSFAELLGVSDRTLRRWESGGTRLTLSVLLTLAGAVHAKDPALAARIAAVHGYTIEELGLGLAPDQLLAHAITSAAAEVVQVPPRAMRPALAAALEKARAAGLTLEALQALLAEPSRQRKRG
jgi:transcriptional regulator with XRE-family HTH domain